MQNSLFLTTAAVRALERTKLGGLHSHLHESFFNTNIKVITVPAM
jgi:hypothetical protein